MAPHQAAFSSGTFAGIAFVDLRNDRTSVVGATPAAIRRAPVVAQTSSAQEEDQRTDRRAKVPSGPDQRYDALRTRSRGRSGNAMTVIDLPCASALARSVARVRAPRRRRRDHGHEHDHGHRRALACGRGDRREAARAGDVARHPAPNVRGSIVAGRTFRSGLTPNAHGSRVWRNQECGTVYSCLSAAIGSIRDARSAGISAASRHAATTTMRLTA